ncbi:MAG: CRP/FNR family cyclic AMP-dependent transcriptional regulator [Verrucomicrobiales bacterium]|jgi:CRP/FNR family cyclic AMP-dependent transcriptional regulator
MANSDSSRDLPSVGALEKLPPGVRRLLAGYGKFESLPHGAFLVRQGTKHASMSLVLKGKLKVTCNAHGDIIDLASLRPGDLVGEVSLIDSHPSSADVIVASDEAELWTIEKVAFDRLLDEHPITGIQVLRVIAEELCHLLRLNSEKMLREVETRKARFLDMDF